MTQIDDFTCRTPIQVWGIVVIITGFVFAFIWLKTWRRFTVSLQELEATNSKCISEMHLKRMGKKPITDRARLPKVTALLPVKGVHKKTLSNWEHQLASTHGGPVEFIFCVESREDPAYEALKRFRQGHRQAGSIKIVVAGLAFSCSQKIHNLLAGVQHISEESDYVLLLDDDAEMKPAIMRDLIWHLEDDPSVLVVTGYPHEYISPTSSNISFAAYMLLSYRKMAYLNISLLHPLALWGGCLMLRREELLDPNIGIISAWKAQGYSDDMIMGGRVHRCKRKMCHPTTCVLITEVEPDYSVLRHLNYIRRQMYALDTYSDSTDQTCNHILLVVVCIFCLTIAFTFQLLSLAAALRIALRLWGGSAAVYSGGDMCGFFPFAPLVLELVLVLDCVTWHLSSFLCDDVITRMCAYLSDTPEQFFDSKSSLSIHVGSFFGFMAQLLVQSSTAVQTLFTNSIVWSGVRYVRRWGKVSEVWRSDAKGKLYTVSAHKSMEEYECLSAGAHSE